jgi:acyl carrier protein
MELRTMNPAIDLENVSRIRAMIAKQLGVPMERVALDACLQDLNVDLVALAQLAIAFEDAFEIEIADEDWLDLETVGQMVAFLVDCREGREKRERPRA